MMESNQKPKPKKRPVVKKPAAPRQDEYHLILRRMPDGDYTVLEGMPSEHQLKSSGAYSYAVPVGKAIVWLVDCNLTSTQTAALVQDALDSLTS
jgi:hypothetical protein